MGKILIVDDSETARTLVKDVLDEAGYDVLSADSGQAGLQLSEEHFDIDLVICDLNMPDMDGLTMCQRLKERPNFAGTPMLMLTTETSSEIKGRAREAGLTGWIVKPFIPHKLLAVVEQLIGPGI